MKIVSLILSWTSQVGVVKAEDLQGKSLRHPEAEHGLFIWAATWQNQESDCAPSDDSDQPGHLPSLIRVFAVHLMAS